MCFQAHLKLFGFVPGAFIGPSTFFALGASITGNVLWLVALGLGPGLLFGYISEEFAKLLNKKVLKGRSGF